MTVNLRDRLFNDTGGVVQNATVQAILVTGGGTDAGTSSVVQSTTSTDVNGVWKFTALPDPGAGNWYDVKITNGNQIRWRYGNIQAVLSSLLLQGTVWASPHFTSPVVDSGGITVAGASTFQSGGVTVQAGGLGVTTGGITVSAGNVGVGNGPVINVGMYFHGGTTTGANQYAISLQHSSDNTATAELGGIFSAPQTAASAFTAATVSGFHAATPVKGAGSTITTAVAFYADAINTGNVNNLGFYSNGFPSGGSGSNVGVQVGTILAGAVTAGIVTNGNGLIVGGTPTAVAGVYGYTGVGNNLGGGATATLGTIGGSGPTSAAQNHWLRINFGTTAGWIPVWA